MTFSFKLVIAFILLLKSTMIFGQVPHHKVSKTILWTVSGNGLKNTSYLLGTNHLFGGSFIDSIGQIMDAINKTNVLVVEKKIDSNSIKNVYSQVPDEGYVPYSKIFTKDQFSQVDKYLSSIGVDSLGSLDDSKFPVWKLYFTVQMDYFAKKFNVISNGENSMDFYIHNLAVLNNKNIIGLDNQSKVQSARTSHLFGSPSDNAEGIVSMINFIQNGIPSVHISLPALELEGINDYRNLNIPYYFKDVTPGKDVPFVQELLIKRNAQWMKLLPSLLSKESCFIAIGIKHLMYKEGLISQLKALGYKVNPVDLKQNSN